LNKEVSETEVISQQVSLTDCFFVTSIFRVCYHETVYVTGLKKLQTLPVQPVSLELFLVQYDEEVAWQCVCGKGGGGGNRSTADRYRKESLARVLCVI